METTKSSEFPWLPTDCDGEEELPYSCPPDAGTSSDNGTSYPCSRCPGCLKYCKFAPTSFDEVKTFPLTAMLRENTRKLFLLWEYLSGEGLQDDAREYLSEHEDECIPFNITL